MARKSKDEAIAKLTKLVADLAGKGKDVLRVSSAVFKGVKEFKDAEVELNEAKELTRGAVERWEKTSGLNKQAMKVLVRFSKFNDAQKSDYLRTLLPGLEALLPGQLDLFADTAPQEDEGEPDTVEAPAVPAGAVIQ